MAQKKPVNYVDKEKLTLALIEYAEQCRLAKEAEEDKPRVPEYIGKSVLDICHRYSFSPSFINYPFREDMVGDAVENCLKYLHNFDPEKSRNPLSYFTQFAFFTFLQRIKREKKQYHTKAKYVQTNALHLDILNQDDSELANDFGSVYYKYVSTLYDVELGEFDPAPKKEKPPKEAGPLDQFADTAEKVSAEKE